MVNSIRLSSKYLTASLLIEELQAERSRLDARFQDVVAQYYFAQANYERTRQQCAHLANVVCAKQEVIEVLLPYYPHPLSPELQHKIALA